MANIDLLVGCYTGGKGDTGLHLVGFDTASGGLSLKRSFPGTPDASYITRNTVTNRIYVTDEMGPRAGAFILSADHQSLSPLGYQPAEEKYPCYVCLSPDRGRLAVADYGSDVVVVFRLDPATGALEPKPQVLRGTGNADPGHGHWVQWSPEGDRLYAVDLGHDEVRMYAWDGAHGQAGPAQTAFKTPAGKGPRHLAFHPSGKRAYLLTEHGNTLTALDRQPDGTLTEIHTVSTIPADFMGTDQAAHIAINPAGSVVYVSNRGHHSIAAFSIGADGRLTHLQTSLSGGDWPRFFLLVGDKLLAANQESDSIVVFDVASDGKLTPNGQKLTIGKPVAILAL